MGSIFIISKDEQLKKIIKTILVPTGYRVLGESADGMNSLRVLRNLSLDLIVLDADVPEASSLEVAKIIAEDKIAPILLISSSWSGEFASKARSTWVFAYAVKPVTEANLVPAAESAITAFMHLSRAEKELDELKKALESRKIIEQAKGLLMENLRISEKDAYHKIRRQSMNKGVPLLDIAKAVILLYQD